MSEQKYDYNYKQITIYFDMRKPEYKALYEWICKKSQNKKRSTFITGLLLRMKEDDRYNNMSKKIALDVIEELKPLFGEVTLIKNQEAESDNTSELIDDMDTLFGGAASF